MQQPLRSLEFKDYHTLRLPDCPISLLVHLAEICGQDATVENLRPRTDPFVWFDMYLQIHSKSQPSEHLVRNACFDVTLTNAKFVKNHEFWNHNGVYVIFSPQTPLGFRASDLDGIARYRALENYNFTLEFGLAGPSSDGISVIVSPKSSIIDEAESFLSSR